MPSKKKKSSSRICHCGKPGVIRINGENLCTLHGDDTLRNMAAHRPGTEELTIPQEKHTSRLPDADAQLPRITKMKALDPELDLRTVLNKAGLR